MPIFAERIDVPSTLDAIPAAPTTPDNNLELISLTEAYDLALSRNLNLYISRYDLALADTNILEWSGIFDPNFTLNHTILSEGIATGSYQSIFLQILQLIN